MDKPFNPAIADNLRDLLPEKRGAKMDKHLSYDLFSYLFELLRLKLNGRKAIVDFASQYHDTRKKWTDFKSIDKQVFKTDSIRSPGMAWQVAELIHAGFCAEALPEMDRLDREIKDLSSNIRKAKESKDWGKEKSLKEKKSEFNKQKDAIRSFMDKKAIWGMHYDVFPIMMAYYLKDDDKDREVDALTLPPFCFRMKLKVKMKTPIVIKGDRPFVANENPFCIDKVTGWPLLRPSTLKGQARHATLACLSEEISDQKERRERIDWLFGSGSEEKEEGHRGRVEFLPCYIEKEVDFDVIAPHDEKTRRVDPGPVSIEVIYPDTPLTLWLQYWPLDLMSKWFTGKKDGIGQELFDDFDTLLKGLSHWFDSVGIGAKASSGYGQVKYHKAAAQLFSAPECPWAELTKKIFGDDDAAKPIHEISQALKQDDWDIIWEKFGQGSKNEGDKNAG